MKTVRRNRVAGITFLQNEFIYTYFNFLQRLPNKNKKNKNKIYMKAKSIIGIPVEKIKDVINPACSLLSTG